MKSFNFKQQTGFYKGKVRDVYSISNNYLVMFSSDRISAFDVILPRPVPFKGQVLNQIAAYMLNATKDICPNWLLNVPAPNVSIGKKCQPFKSWHLYFIELIKIMMEQIKLQKHFLSF